MSVSSLHVNVKKQIAVSSRRSQARIFQMTEMIQYIIIITQALDQVGSRTLNFGWYSNSTVFCSCHKYYFVADTFEWFQKSISSTSWEFSLKVSIALTTGMGSAQGTTGKAIESLRSVFTPHKTRLIAGWTCSEYINVWQMTLLPRETCQAWNNRLFGHFVSLMKLELPAGWWHGG